jgi:hypothetical protein
MITLLVFYFYKLKGDKHRHFRNNKLRSQEGKGIVALGWRAAWPLEALISSQ